jgi:hypothetical protein
MSNAGKKRFGDLSVRRWRASAAAKPAILAVAVFLVVTAVVTTKHWIDAGDTPHILGSVIGISLAVLVMLAAVTAWAMYWRGLAWAVSEVGTRSAGALVLGARLPRLAASVLAQSWPKELGQPLPPQNVVIQVDPLGATLFNTKRPPSKLIEIPWSQVQGLSVVEYVEADRAYPGLALEVSKSNSAIVFQLITPSLPFVRFPKEEQLAETCANANALRPPTHSTESQ